MGQARAQDLAQQGWLPDKQNIVKNMVLKNVLKGNAAVSILGHSGINHIQKKHTVSPNTVFIVPTAGCLQPVGNQSTLGCHCKHNDNLQVSHRKGQGTFFYRKVSVPTNWGVVLPCFVILLGWIYHNKDFDPLQNKILIH